MGGTCKTVMIANIPPTSYSFEEILNTLKYANRAKNIKVKPNQTVKNVTYHVKEYQRIISDLRNEIFELKQQMTRAQKENNSSSDFIKYDSVKVSKFYVFLLIIKEQKQFMEIQQQIIDNFNDKMQLRKSLIDLEDTNAVDRIEIEKKYEEIAK